jgi:hypothetical protein
VIPEDETGDEVTVGGFCATDRAAMGPDTLAVDAVGDVDDDPLAELSDLGMRFFIP